MLNHPEIKKEWHRAAYRLRERDDLTYVQIAHVLHRNPNAVALFFYRLKPENRAREETLRKRRALARSIA